MGTCQQPAVVGCHLPTSVFPISGCSKRVTWCPTWLRRWTLLSAFPRMAGLSACIVSGDSDCFPCGCFLQLQAPRAPAGISAGAQGSVGLVLSLSGLHVAVDFTVTSSDQEGLHGFLYFLSGGVSAAQEFWGPHWRVSTTQPVGQFSAVARSVTPLLGPRGPECVDHQVVFGDETRWCQGSNRVDGSKAESLSYLPALIFSGFLGGRGSFLFSGFGAIPSGAQDLFLTFVPRITSGRVTCGVTHTWVTCMATFCLCCLPSPFVWISVFPMEVAVSFLTWGSEPQPTSTWAPFSNWDMAHSFEPGCWPVPSRAGLAPPYEPQEGGGLRIQHFTSAFTRCPARPAGASVLCSWPLSPRSHRAQA